MHVRPIAPFEIQLRSGQPPAGFESDDDLLPVEQVTINFLD
jgi:hypothetical protein